MTEPEYRVAIENNVEGRSIAWVLTLPGCYAYGKDQEAAWSAAPQAIRDYAAWVEERGGQSWGLGDDVQILLEDTWEVYCINDDFQRATRGYEVNAWFQHDWKPLSDEDVARGVQILTWSRAELLEVVAGLSQEKLEMASAGQRWSIKGILNHVGGAEWWYLDRLGLASPQDQAPDEPFERLREVRERLMEVLPSLVGWQRVVGVDGELWSPRKMLRRAAWHERDHTAHIRQLR